MSWLPVLIPALAAAVAMLLPAASLRRLMLPVGAVAHLASVVLLWVRPEQPAGKWLGADGLGLLFLTITSGLFLTASVYAVGYLRRESGRATQDAQEGFLFTNEPERVFIGCLLGFLAAMSLVCLCQHMGLLWVAVELTTLVSAPLIYFHRHHRSLEATWKYLLICSVGIALAMLGNMSLAYAAKGATSELTLEALRSHAGQLHAHWLKIALLMLVVGYGTKMGLAPMHTWLPDAHSEAPSVVSALLSGALLNCAFLGILRAHTIVCAAGLGDFSGQLLTTLGMVSMGLAGLLLIRQRDYKRLLAYSSIEHMGILALGVGLGGVAAGGALLHAVNHSLAKGMLFLLAGNVLSRYGTKDIGRIGELIRRQPVTGVLWVVGLLAITGSPPFGAFWSELAILRGALEGGRWLVAGGYLLALGVIFAAMARALLPMVFAKADLPAPLDPADAPEAWWSVAPPIALAAGALVLGVWVPAPMWTLLGRLGASLGGPA